MMLKLYRYVTLAILVHGSFQRKSDSSTRHILSKIFFVKEMKIYLIVITLWFPYVLWTAIYSLLHNFFISINVYTDNSLLLKYVSGKHIGTVELWSFEDMAKNIVKAMFLHGGTQMGAAFWFLATLMEISVAYCVIDFLLKILFKQNSKRTFVGLFIPVCLSLLWKKMISQHKILPRKKEKEL